jgi:hypothetical protein
LASLDEDLASFFEILPTIVSAKGHRKAFHALDQNAVLKPPFPT